MQPEPRPYLFFRFSVSAECDTRSANTMGTNVFEPVSVCTNEFEAEKLPPFASHSYGNVYAHGTSLGENAIRRPMPLALDGTNERTFYIL